MSDNPKPIQEAAPAPTAPQPPVVKYGRAARWAITAMVVTLLALTLFLWWNHRESAAQRAALRDLQSSMTDLAHGLESLHLPAAPAEAPAESSAGDYYGLLTSGNLELRQGRLERAFSYFQAAVKADSRGLLSDEAHYRLGMCYLQKTEPAGALVEFQTVVTSHPGSPYYPRALLETTRLLMEKKEFTQARRLLYRFIGCRDRIAPEDSDCLAQAYYDVARCYEGEAEVVEANDVSRGASLDLPPGKDHSNL